MVPMPRIYYCLLLTCFFTNHLFAQSDSIQEVKGIPTKQIYDLMVDKKGFLWIGHDLGISRFDGVTFTHFSNPQSTSLAVGDICEDEQGRIWFHNFSSQIFYIENEKMHLLNAYDYESEPRFPRMVIVGNKLIATSEKGLFVCNTATLEGKYIHLGDEKINSSTLSISLVNKEIVAQGSKWYKYNPYTNTSTQLNLSQEAKKIKSVTLQPFSYKDTIYSFSNISAEITKLFLTGDSLKVVGYVATKGIMNTINPSGIDTWIHSKKESVSIDGTKKITGYDLGDMVVDKEGNTWYSSFKYGLLIKYENNWKKINLTELDEGDVITHFDVKNNLIVYGTANGKIIIATPGLKKILKTFVIPKSAGPIELVKWLDSSRCIIGSSLRIFLIDNSQKTLLNIFPQLSLKDAVMAGSSIFLATATGLYKLTVNANNYKLKQINSERCRSVGYSQQTKTLLVAFKDELIEIKNNKSTKLLYNGSSIRTSAIYESEGKFYIATFNQGLLLISNSLVSSINIFNNQKVNAIFKVKIFKDTAWLLAPGFIEMFNTKTEKPFDNVAIPSLPNIDIYDIVPIQSKPIILTSDGLYKLQSPTFLKGFKFANYLMKVTVNGNDTTMQNKIVLPFDKNNVEIFLAAPFFTNPDKIYFKFRLAGSIDDGWKISENGERVFRYSSLKPGKYKFEAIAVHPQFGSAEKPITFEFTIKHPWYDTLLFKLLLILFVSILVFIFVRKVFNSRLKQQKINYEQQLIIQIERQRISAEIHDDIGAGLSAVKLLTELTGKKIEDATTKNDLNKIYLSIADLSSKMRDVIWSLNSKNDSLENLLLYIQRQARQLLENSDMHLQINLPEEIPAINIGSEKRTDIYLSVKEALHNTLKHSGAKNVELDFEIENDSLCICVTDDGIGMPEFIEGTGNGIINIKKRMKRSGGIIDFKNDHGTKINFYISLKEKNEHFNINSRG
jgi:signal transduction histidine kinase